MGYQDEDGSYSMGFLGENGLSRTYTLFNDHEMEMEINQYGAQETAKKLVFGYHHGLQSFNTSGDDKYREKILTEEAPSEVKVFRSLVNKSGASMLSGLNPSMIYWAFDSVADTYPEEVLQNMSQLLHGAKGGPLLNEGDMKDVADSFDGFVATHGTKLLRYSKDELNELSKKHVDKRFCDWNDWNLPEDSLNKIKKSCSILGTELHELKADAICSVINKSSYRVFVGLPLPVLFTVMDHVLKSNELEGVTLKSLKKSLNLMELARSECLL